MHQYVPVFWIFLGKAVFLKTVSSSMHIYRENKITLNYMAQLIFASIRFLTMVRPRLVKRSGWAFLSLHWLVTGMRDVSVQAF